MKTLTKRATITRRVKLPPAPGIISRRLINTILEPGEIGQGIIARRIDQKVEWPVTLQHVVAATNCTAIGDAETGIAYVEHALAALWGAGISDAVIVTDGPELPLFDGSALPWCEALSSAGRYESNTDWPPLVLKQAEYLQTRNGCIIGLPAKQSFFSYVLEYEHPFIGRQWADWDMDVAFSDALAPARTFATADQVRAMLGIEVIPPEVETLAVVVYEDHVSASQALPQAFARHKLIDLIGDLFLAGRPVVGRITALKTGHADNHRFLQALLDTMVGGSA